MYTFLDLIPSNFLIIVSIEPSNELAGAEIDSSGREELSIALFKADENVFKLVNKSLSKVIVLSPNNTGSVGSFPLLLFNPKNIYWPPFINTFWVADIKVVFFDDILVFVLEYNNISSLLELINIEILKMTLGLDYYVRIEKTNLSINKQIIN